MKRRHLVAVAAVAFSVTLTGTLARSQSQPPTEGPAVGATPAWFLQGSFPDPTGRTVVDPGGRVTVPPRSGPSGPGAAAVPSPAVAPTPACSHSPLCGKRLGRGRQTLQ